MNLKEEYFYIEEDAMNTAIRKIMVATTLWTFVVPASICAAASHLKQRPVEAQYEQKLGQEVRHQLVLLPFYSVFDNLEFSVKHDTVTLMGQVVRPTLKSDAEAAVKHLEGAAQVVNDIEVLPVSPSDDRLRRALYHKIYGDDVLHRYALQAVPPIHIIVKNGHVTLVGVVATEMDKNIAGMRANGVSGVFSVENQLHVENKKG
jgi:osmotically-inducible protein OsmY